MYLQVGQGYIQQISSLHIMDSHNVRIEWWLNWSYFISPLGMSVRGLSLIHLEWMINCKKKKFVFWHLTVTFFVIFSVSIFACGISLSSFGVSPWPSLRTFSYLYNKIHPILEPPCLQGQLITICLFMYLNVFCYLRVFHLSYLELLGGLER